MKRTNESSGRAKVERTVSSPATGEAATARLRAMVRRTPASLVGGPASLGGSGARRRRPAGGWCRSPVDARGAAGEAGVGSTRGRRCGGSGRRRSASASRPPRRSSRGAVGDRRAKARPGPTALGRTGRGTTRGRGRGARRRGSDGDRGTGWRDRSGGNRERASARRRADGRGREGHPPGRRGPSSHPSRSRARHRVAASPGGETRVAAPPPGRDGRPRSRSRGPSSGSAPARRRVDVPTRSLAAR